MGKEKIRIGCGAGFSGDRIEPAILLAEKGGLDYLVLECLAERTIALAQKRKRQDPNAGYDPVLEKRIVSLLPLLVKNKICLITNMGAANPIAGAKKIIEIAKKLSIKIKVVAVTGDDVHDVLQESAQEYTVLENGKSLKAYEIVSANAYLGVAPILDALKMDAQVIITGRVADPSLFLAPMIHALGWSTDDYQILGKGTVAGHLLECAGQVTGGYFADPGKKEVPDLAHLGHPYVDVFADGTATISKVAGTGGMVNAMTVKEQLLYEVIDPQHYYTPDVVADFTKVAIQDLGGDRVFVQGGDGAARPETYKVSVGYKAFYLGEGEISYAGPNALARAKLAGKIMEERLKDRVDEIRIDYMGIQSVHRVSLEKEIEPYEVRLRVAAKAPSLEAAAIVGEEVEALYTNGPAGGAGARKYVNEIIGIVSVLMDRKKLNPQTTIFES